MTPTKPLENSLSQPAGSAEIRKQDSPGRVSPRWYALRVRPRHEKSVFEQLGNKEYSAFLPLYSARRRWADRWKVLSLPLFPGYVFCCFDTAARSRVLATPGVIDVVRLGSEPAPIASSEIEAIRLVAASNLKAEPYPSLVRGQRVVVDGGPLNGVAGTLMQVRNGVRLVISVELLQRSVQVEIEREHVVPSEQEVARSMARQI